VAVAAGAEMVPVCRVDQEVVVAVLVDSPDRLLVRELLDRAIMAVHLVVPVLHFVAAEVVDMERRVLRVLVPLVLAAADTPTIRCHMLVEVAVVLWAQMWLEWEVVPLAETAVD
jgi:hypothetical protein